MLGGEGRVVQLLENESGKYLEKSLLEGSDENCSRKQRSFCDFVMHPSTIGKDLLSIEKFGLVQYVSLFYFFSYA